MNWGNKLILVFIAFGLLMFFMVYKSMNTHFDLVTRQYYSDELAYQGIIDAKGNAMALKGKTIVKQKDDQFYLQLPTEHAGGVNKGKIWFYCVTDASKDRTFELDANSEGIQQIPLQELVAEKYTVKLEWTNGDKKYYTEEKFEKSR